MHNKTLIRMLNRGALFVCIALAMTLPGFSQDYTIEEYNEYQKALSDGPDALIAWAKAHSESSLSEYVAPTFIGWAKEHVDKSEFDQAITVSEKYLSEIDGELFDILYLATWSAYQAGQYDKAAKYGEKVYQQKPETPEILTILANTYLKLGNTQKTVEYGEKYCAQAELKDCWGFYPLIARHYAEQKDWKNAQANARKVIEAMDAAAQPPGVSAEEWTKYVGDEKAQAHAIVGRAAFESESWKSARTSFEKLLVMSPNNNGRRAEAYFYIGMSQWRLEEIRPAMETFAKGSQIEGAETAKYCRQQLETLYKATHNGSLAGLDEFLEKHRP